MTSVRSRLAALVAVALVAAAGLVGLSSGPAAAALCSGSGVNVVVDFNGLGGGVQKGCDPGGAGRSGDKVFPAAGFGLTYAQREPGFVCRVRNAPTERSVRERLPDQCLLGSLLVRRQVRQVDLLVLGRRRDQRAEWRLPRVRVAERRECRPARSGACEQQAGTGHQGADQEGHQGADEEGDEPAGLGLGGNQCQGGRRSHARPAHQDARGCRRKPAEEERRQGEARSASKQAKAKAKASASASARSSASASAAADPSDEASPDATSAKPVDSAFAPEQEQNGLPVWVPVLVVLALAGAAGGTAWWRRRTGAP